VALTAYSVYSGPAHDLTTRGNLLLTSLSSLLAGTVLSVFFRMPLLDNIISGLLAILSAVYVAYGERNNYEMKLIQLLLNSRYSLVLSIRIDYSHIISTKIC
jgi:FtsH-binding integral membrane protein